MRIIGIDPGYDRLGIAIVEKASPRDKEILLYSECFITSGKGKNGDKKNTDIYKRLLAVGQRIRTVIEEYEPQAMAMETLFITKNQKTAMHVAEARGIIAYEAKLHGLQVFEYSPPQIKAAITSDGRSDKNQIMKMIPLLIKMPRTTSVADDGEKTAKRHDDEYDAIAVALTCIASNPLKNQAK